MLKTGETLYRHPVLLLLTFATLQLTSAVDIIFWSGTRCGTGEALGCWDVPENACCFVSRGHPSVDIKSMDDCKETHVFRRGGCDTEVKRATDNTCFLGGYFTGAKWVRICRSPELLPEVDARELERSAFSGNECKNSVNPNTVLYTDDSRKGFWVLKNDDATSLLEKLQSLPESEKVAWLISNGASFESDTQEASKVVSVGN